jgi:transcription initiation factor TFIIIB Brf1 subunit/transcription initiation factor TFIIB|tara:strand:- start:1390 stop:2358 length:969 start_codon:yes stop_codon:yes gene_type:complete
MENVDFSAYFEELTTHQAPKVVVKGTCCCDEVENYLQGNGVIECKVCGNMIHNIVDTPEWRNYDSGGKDTTRCGMPGNSLLPMSSLGTSVSTVKRDMTTNKIGMYQRWNSMPYKERSLYKVYMEIDSKCASQGIPKIISTTAKSLYRIISATKISRGANRVGIIAACVYNACKECGVPRTVHELSRLFDIETKVMTKGCKNYTDIIRMSKTDMSRITDVKSIDLNDFIRRFSHQLQLKEGDIDVIYEIAALCNDVGVLCENTPPSMASGCIFLYIKSTNKSITKKQISDVCNISEVTINKCYKKLAGHQVIVDFALSLAPTT